MRRALAVTFVWVSVLSGGFEAANRENLFRHPAIREVMLMMRGGVAYDVMVERVKRMPEVPELDAAAIGTLTNQGVPDKVLLALAQRTKTAVRCPIPERKLSPREVFDDPSIRQVLGDLDAGTPTKAILERVERLHAVPVLDARAIEKLTSDGVPDRVLLALVRKEEVQTGCDPVRKELLASVARTPRDGRAKKKDEPVLPASLASVPSAPDSRTILVTDQNTSEVPAEPRAARRRHEASAAEAIGLGRIQIVAKSSLPVTYLQVLLDGDIVAKRGEIEEGETKPGWMLPRPPVLNVKKGAVVFECALPAGPHEVQTTFALSRIVETGWDDVVEARGQRYDTTKVGPSDEDGGVPVCDVPEGKTCVVLARLVKKGDGYTITYDSKVR